MMPNKGKIQDGLTAPITRVMNIIDIRKYSMEHHTRSKIAYNKAADTFMAECVCGHVEVANNFDSALERSQWHVRQQWDEAKYHLFTVHHEDNEDCDHVSCTCGWYRHDLDSQSACAIEHGRHLQEYAKTTR